MNIKMENCKKSCKMRLCERNKELNCLYEMAELIEEKNTDINQILRNFINIIPPAMQFPEQTHAKLKIGKRVYKSIHFNESNLKMDKTIYEETIPIGVLSVYRENTNLSQKKKFILPEENALIQYLCERIGRVIQRYNLSKDLESTKNKFEIQNQILEKKNVALFEVLDHLENEKEKIQKEILSNVDMIILPLLEKMKIDPNPKLYIDILNTALTDIISTFGSKLRNDFINFTPREIEICNLLKNGKTSKEIGDFLSVSAQTINKHRDHIRIKLGIKNKKVNLVSFLNSLM